MKKIISFIMSVLLFGILTFSASAGEYLPVIDTVGVLSDDEYTALCEKLLEICDTYGVEPVFVISDEILAEDAQSEADDIYDYFGYGVGESCDGILYFVCEPTHEYAFSTCGRAIEIFNDDGLEYIDEAMLPYLKKGDYYQAALRYADKCEELIKMAAEGEPYTKKVNIVYVIAGIILIPLLAAFALMQRKLSKMNTAVMQAGAAEYIKPGSMNLTTSNDIFLYSTVSKREKEKTNSGGTHTSSSGKTHGGRSGSF